MTPLDASAIFGAGLAAGTINTIVGSGSLITFPTLLALGYPAVLANVSNTVGLVPGSVSGAIGYRRELRGQRGRLARMSALGAVGGLTGGALLLVLPGSVFESVVPALILLACALVAGQPRLSRLRTRTARAGVLLAAGVFLTAVYGGYFGAAQGVLLIAIFAILIDDDIQRLNAAKNVVAAVVNAVAAVLFIAATDVAWSASGLLALGSIIGGQAGALIGRRLSPLALRAVIVVVGVVVAGELLAG